MDRRSSRQEQLRTAIREAVAEVEITDVHTHLYPPAFGDLLLWGIDELVNYHYLVAEVFRYTDLSYEEFWRMSKREQADLIWRHLFVENSPIGEACRGVLTTLHVLGLDVGARDLAGYRPYFEQTTTEEYVSHVFEVARIKQVVMTNDPFDDRERECWLDGREPDPRFRAGLRIDPLLNGWPTAWQRLGEWGYRVGEELNGETVGEVRRFLREWVERMDAVYLAASLPPTFAFPEESARGTLVRECVLPVCEELDRPFAMMIGVKKLVNPGLRDAGDSVGKADIGVVERLCAEYPKNKFLVTMLARENQHELCVAARKFRNLLVFGCWWFLNNPRLVDEITRMRIELLGLSMVPQHSDARVLDQLIYKWTHSRQTIARVLCEKYVDLMATGWVPEEAEIRRDVGNLFGGTFWTFLDKKL
jgi:hypothetical protein